MNNRFLWMGIATLVMAATTFAHAAGPTPAKRPPASKRPTKTATSAPTAAKGTAALLKKFRAAMTDGDLAKAAGVLSAARTSLAETRAKASDEEAGRWNLCEAELELARGRSAKAGLAAMRVVVQRPRTEQAGEGLYWAARAYEKLQRSPKAAELYRECLEQKRLAASVRKRAQASLAALEKKVDSR
ncbi:MAG TPA: hypothetical protein VJZ71_13865 [Phycisphaerae bacterium]|nr:hypothetical protein [Phycisphaerae bacterium]